MTYTVRARGYEAAAHKAAAKLGYSKDQYSLMEAPFRARTYGIVVPEEQDACDKGFGAASWAVAIERNESGEYVMTITKRKLHAQQSAEITGYTKTDDTQVNAPETITVVAPGAETDEKRDFGGTEIDFSGVIARREAAQLNGKNVAVPEATEAVETPIEAGNLELRARKTRPGAHIPEQDGRKVQGTVLYDKSYGNKTVKQAKSLVWQTRPLVRLMINCSVLGHMIGKACALAEQTGESVTDSFGSWRGTNDAGMDTYMYAEVTVQPNRGRFNVHVRVVQAEQEAAA